MKLSGSGTYSQVRRMNMEERASDKEALCAHQTWISDDYWIE